MKLSQNKLRNYHTSRFERPWRWQSAVSRLLRQPTDGVRTTALQRQCTSKSKKESRTESETNQPSGEIVKDCSQHRMGGHVRCQKSYTAAEQGHPRSSERRRRTPSENRTCSSPKRWPRSGLPPTAGGHKDPRPDEDETAREAVPAGDTLERKSGIAVVAGKVRSRWAGSYRFVAVFAGKAVSTDGSAFEIGR